MRLVNQEDQVCEVRLDPLDCLVLPEQWELLEELEHLEVLAVLV